jgi:hypothetical protein
MVVEMKDDMDYISFDTEDDGWFIVSIQKGYTIDTSNWLMNNVNPIDWYVLRIEGFDANSWTIFYKFRNKDDALLFKLTWAGT